MLFCVCGTRISALKFANRCVRLKVFFLSGGGGKKDKSQREKRKDKNVQIFQIAARKLGMGHDLDLVVADF